MIAATGSNPPEGKVRGGDEPVKSVMSVRSFDPELTVSAPGLPSKLPTKMGPGLLSTGKTVGFWSLQKKPPTPGSNQTSFEPLLLTSRSAGPPPGGFRTAVATGPIPCLVGVFRFSRGPFVNV